MAATRTLNPLHFEDLEPHRFEDLVRQLVYDFRDWKSLEATGRLGGDDGIDILGIEQIQIEKSTTGGREDESEDVYEDESIDTYFEREWIIQCKREQKISPSKITKIVEESIQSKTPYGFIVAAACDFSKKTRDTFRLEARNKGIEEFYLWGKAELEDMLFQPKNDYLLFAYFNISLKVRHKSIQTSLKSKLTIKRKLIKVLGDVKKETYTPVLIINAINQGYPKIVNKAEFIKKPQWKYFNFVGHLYPDHLAFIVKRYRVYIDDNGENWDAYFKEDMAKVHYPEIVGIEKDDSFDNSIYEIWNKIPEKNQGWLNVYGFIKYERILAIDEHGDSYHDGPHLLVEFKGRKGPFDWFSERIEFGSHYYRQYADPVKEKRIKYFPDNEE